MQQESATTENLEVTRFDELSMNEIAGELERRLGAYYEEKSRGGNPPRAEVVKASLLVYYGPAGHRAKLTRTEALRFLDIIAEPAPGQAEAIQEGIVASA